MASEQESWRNDGAGIADIVRRIWARDFSLWQEASPGADGDWLGWLDLPATQACSAAASRELLDDFREFDSLNVLGMGGSSLTAEVLRTLFPDSHPKLRVFDTINPIAILDALEAIDFEKAAFAVASKSGSTIEPLALELVFRSALNNVGVADTSSHFFALTDPGSTLASRATNGEFKHHVATPANVGGRFSALSEFGMTPADICGMPTELIAKSATAMSDECRSENADNPGVELGLFMARNALRGRDKVTLAISPSLERFGLWLEQLLAESTGKNGRGLIPIAGEPILPRDSYGEDRQFIRIELEGDRSVENPAYDDHPTYAISLPDRTSIGGEFFRWEFATAVAAAAIGVYPFDQPDVEAAKEFARDALGSSSPDPLPILSLGDAVKSAIRNHRKRDYIAIVAYLPETHHLTEAMSDLRRAISNATGIATTFGYGPRYLHSTGQLHKGGPKSVQLLAVTQASDVDVEVPGETYTLGELSNSQAVGDVMACQNAGRRAKLVRIDNDPISLIKSTIDELNKK